MGWLKAELMTWLVRNDGAYITTQRSPVAFARNAIVAEFLSRKEDYLLMVDSDTVPPDDAVEKLLKIADKNTVTTGVTAILKGNSLCPNVYIETEHVEECHPVSHFTKPFEVAGCGASCMLIPRKLLEKMEVPYFKTIEFDEEKICSEDLYFCEQVRKVGGKIMCDPSVQATHFKEVGLKV